MRTINASIEISLSKSLEISCLRSFEHLPGLFPFLIFFASLFNTIKMTDHQEIQVLKSFGISFRQLSLSLVLSFFFMGVTYLFLLSPLLSSMHARLVHIERHFFSHKRDSFSILPTGLWIKENSKDVSRILHAKSCDLKEGRFDGLKFYQFDPHTMQVQEIIQARYGSLQNKSWNFFDVHLWDQEGKDLVFNKLSRPTHFTLQTLQDMQDPPETFSLIGLYRFIQDGKKIGLHLVKHKLHFHSEISKVGMMIAMSILGLSLMWNHSRFYHSFLLLAGGVFFSLMIHFLNQLVLGMSATGRIPILLACWMRPLATLFLAWGIVFHHEDH